MIGFTVAASVRGRPSTLGSALVAGVMFSVCQLIFVFVLRRATVDRDLLPVEPIGALLIGAATVRIAGPRAAR